MEDRQGIRDWFDAPKPELPTLAVVAGLVILIVGLLLLGNGQIAGGLLLAVASVLLVVIKGKNYLNIRDRYETRPSTELMLQWLSEDFAKVKENSLPKFGLASADLTRESMVIAGPLLWSRSRPGSDQTRWRRRSVENEPSGPFLYECWVLCVIHFTQGSVMVCRFNYDWYDNHVVDETAEAISYGHLVSVRTQVDSSGKGEFVLSLSNQDAPAVAFGGTDLRPANEEQLKAQADFAVQAIHSAMRDWTAVGTRRYAGAPGPAAGSQPSLGTAPNFCANCGRRFQPEEVFCPNCGLRT